jgi:hypothetical protein
MLWKYATSKEIGVVREYRQVVVTGSLTIDEALM